VDTDRHVRGQEILRDLTGALQLAARRVEADEYHFRSLRCPGPDAALDVANQHRVHVPADGQDDNGACLGLVLLRGYHRGQAYGCNGGPARNVAEAPEPRTCTRVCHSRALWLHLSPHAL